jgi:hypothetical protein
MMIEGDVVNRLTKRLGVVNGITLGPSEASLIIILACSSTQKKMTVTVIFSLARHTPSATSASSQF